MNLFLVIILNGHIGGVAGPLPYGMDECKRRRGLIQSGYDQAVADGKLDPDQMQVVCVYQSVRPSLNGEPA